jgi:hypothetical protein
MVPTERRASSTSSGPMGWIRRRTWITERLDQLDPEADYAEIVRLSTLYGANDLQMHWFYAVSTPAAALAPAVLDAVWREGKGTYNSQPAKRRDDSVDHLLVWFEHGPDADATKKSVDMVNRYHAHFAKTYPSGFDDAEDYIYILCLNATAVYSSIRSLGLTGFSDKQKRAMYLFWSKLTEHFTVVTEARPVPELQSFPTSFDAMVKYVDDYQKRSWPVHHPGHLSTTSAIEHFASRWFPRPLRFFGRALVTAFMSPAVLRAHAITPPPPPLRWAARAAMKTMMLFSTHVLPDPRESFTDGRRRRGVSGGNSVDVAVHRAVVGCPHLAAVATAESR